MTANQVAKLAYPTSETIQISGKTYSKTYQSANNMLRRMAGRKELKCQEFDTASDWFMLNSTPRIKDPRKYKHEHGAAELFTAYYPIMREHSGKWGYEPKVLKDRADRGMRLFDKTFYLEIDRGTESPREIAGKLENYINFQRETGQIFHVIFVLMDNSRSTAYQRVQKLNPVFRGYQNGNQFLLAGYEKLILNPLGNLLYDPKKDALYSLQQVT